ncbi:hypothetical protein MNBD_PLANCTO02-1406 [hydrothermal vent metagenome]|uniref:Uncharacterized protein n=1 Tax=hydrothermal vent metagenome TaxID=652676 RepID=A0A3B1E457_9ZZZZ
MNIRDGIYHSLWAGGALLVVLLLAFSLWLTLQVMGDMNGAAGAKGVVCLTVGLSVLNFIGLVVMTSIATIQSDSNNSSNELSV